MIGIARTGPVANSHPTLEATMIPNRQQILGGGTSLWWLFARYGRAKGRFCRVVAPELCWAAPCGPTVANTSLYDLCSLLPPSPRDHLVSSC